MDDPSWLLTQSSDIGQRCIQITVKTSKMKCFAKIVNG